MGSITDRINDDVREEIRKQAMNAYDLPLMTEYSKICLQGLLASGAGVSYDTAHQAFQMARFMMEVRQTYNQGW